MDELTEDQKKVLRSKLKKLSDLCVDVKHEASIMTRKKEEEEEKRRSKRKNRPDIYDDPKWEKERDTK